jgi:hypothetical protein
LRLDEQDISRDDAGIIAEQQATDGGNADGDIDKRIYFRFRLTAHPSRSLRKPVRSARAFYKMVSAENDHSACS